jgi:hypothetical protein
LLGAAWLAALSLSVAPPFASAKEIAYDQVSCWSATMGPPVATADGVAVGSYELRGIVVRSNLEDKSAENRTFHCVSVYRAGGKDASDDGYCKILAAEGDYMVVQTARSGPLPAEGRRTFLYGTGRFAGIKGGGTSRQINRGAPATPGTLQGCNHDTGKFTLPD